MNRYNVRPARRLLSNVVSDHEILSHDETISPQDFLRDIKRPLLSFIDGKRGNKVQLTLTCEMQRVDLSTGEIAETTEAHFRTLQTPVHVATDLQAMYEPMIAKMLEALAGYTGRNVRFACLQIYCKSCYKFQICNDLPHLHACKLLICTRGKLGGKCGNGREAVRRKSVANPLQTNYFATSLHVCKFNANTKFASDLHIRKSVDYIKLANGLQTCKLVANMKFAIGLHHVLYVRKLVANNKFASDLHIRKCVDYTNYTKPLV